MNEDQTVPNNNLDIRFSFNGHGQTNIEDIRMSIRNARTGKIKSELIDFQKKSNLSTG